MRDSKQTDYYGPLKRPRFAVFPFLKSSWKIKTKESELKVFIRDHLAEPDQLQALANVWGHFVQSQEGLLENPALLNSRNIIVRQAQGRLSLALKGDCMDGREQHPQRSHVSPSQAIAFPGFAIYLSILALAENPKLWKNYCLDQAEGLLFEASDFESPTKSGVFRSLRRLPQPIPKLTQQLQNICLSKYPNLPSLSLEQLQSSKTQAEPASTSSTPVEQVSPAPQGQSPRPVKWLALLTEIVEFVLRMVLGALYSLGTAIAVVMALPTRKSQKATVATAGADDLSQDVSQDIWADQT